MRRTIDDGTTGRRAGMYLSVPPPPRWLGAALMALGAFATAEASLAQTKVQARVAYSFDTANYWGTELQILSMTDPQACALACDKEPRCVVASLHDATVGGKYHNKCVLRSEPGARHPENAGVHSWVKGSAPSAPGLGPGHCDVRRVDWRNMTYPDFVLRGGSAKTDPGWHIELQDKDIVYGDLRGDGSKLAFVPVYEGGDADGTTAIFVVDADSSCAPRLLLTTGGQLNTSGKIVGGGYVFERYDNALGSDVKIEVRWVGGRLIEARAPQGAAPSTPSPSTAPIPPSRTQGAAPVGACDLHTVNWKNMSYPAPADSFVSAFHLRDGQAPNVISGHGGCPGMNADPTYEEDKGYSIDFQGVSYGDIEGKGSPQAFVSFDFAGIGCGSESRSAVYVFKMADDHCSVRSLGTVGYGGGKIVGNIYVDDSGLRWRIVDGKVQQVK
jgi:hypothetical protein